MIHHIRTRIIALSIVTIFAQNTAHSQFDYPCDVFTGIDDCNWACQDERNEYEMMAEADNAAEVLYCWEEHARGGSNSDLDECLVLATFSYVEMMREAALIEAECYNFCIHYSGYCDTWT